MLSILAWVWIGLVCAAPSHAAGRQMLHGHVPAAVRALTPIQRMEPTAKMHLAIGLPLRNQAQLAELVKELYDPHSANYGQYLKPGEFAERFGPAEADYKAVIDFARSHGLTVTGVHGNRVVVDVEGAVADVEKAFHVKMQVYQHPTEGRKFHAPDAEPSVDLATPILYVNGLTDFAVTHPYYKGRKAAAKVYETFAGTGSAPDTSYAGGDFRAAYMPGTTLTGTGQCLGLVEFDTFYASDIAQYKSEYNIPDMPVITVNIDGGTGSPGQYNGEVALDIEMAMAMAPGLSAVYVYTGNNSNGNSQWEDMLSRMAEDDTCKQISCSWGGNYTDPTAELLLQQLASQGQAFFAASGDSDAYYSPGNPIYFPSDSVNVTSVGGTTLTTSGAGGSYTSETVWNWGGGAGGSGGVTTNGYGIPWWQQGVSMTANQGSTSLRNLPDVAMVADDIDVISNNGQEGGVGGGGTSFAAPLWAGVMALANQQAAASGRGPIGFLNPTVYAIGKGSGYTSAFHDITSGNNYDSGSPSKYAAVTGYDLCDGWGSPTGMNLINAIVAPNDALQVSLGAFNVTGTAGGPYSGTSYTYTLVNNGASPINWTASNTQSWLGLGQSSGTLAASGSTTVVASLTSQANHLTLGSYTDAITFTDSASGLKQLRAVNATLAAPAPLVTTGTASQLSSMAATLNGTMNANGLSGIGWFEYGTTPSYGNTTREQDADDAEGYTSWGYGANAGSGLGWATYLEGVNGGLYLVNASTGGRQIDGNNSFGVYAGSGTQAMCRQIENAKSFGVMTFSARFDVSNTVGFSGFNLKSSQGTHFGDGELLSFGLTPSTGNHCIFVGGTTTQYINLGSELRGSIIDFQVLWDTVNGVYELGARFHGGSTYSTVTGTLKASGSNADYFGAGNFNSGSNQNLIFDDVVAYMSQSVESGTSPAGFSAIVTGQNIAATYHYRAAAWGEGGIAYGADQTYQTLPAAPAVTPTPATGVESWMATLNATVNPNGAATTCYFEVEDSPVYYTTAVQGAGSGMASVPVSCVIKALPGTTYTYRIDATNSGGTSSGNWTSVTMGTGTDGNGDGLPDDWETYYFGTTSVNVDGDPSGGGYTNLENYLMGTSPLDPTTQLHPTIAVSGTVATISFNSVAGVVYQVEYTAQLAGGPWTQLGGPLDGTGGILSVTDSVTAPRFYEVVAHVAVP